MAFVAMSAFSAVAQNDIKLYAGAAFPNGKFGEFKEDYFSLTNGQKEVWWRRNRLESGCFL